MTHITAQGDTWDSIAYAHLGSVLQTDILMRCNTQYLGYVVFPAGLVLVLPQVQSVDMKVSSAAPPWKKVSG